MAKRHKAKAKTLQGQGQKIYVKAEAIHPWLVPHLYCSAGMRTVKFYCYKHRVAQFFSCNLPWSY